MHYEFEHSDIIEEYEQLISYKKVVGSELNKRGRNEIIYEDNDIYIVYFQVSPMELNENNGFQSGDLKIFCRTNQKNILSENDIITAFGTDYIIKNEIPLEYSDYKVFLARRVVDDERR